MLHFLFLWGFTFKTASAVMFEAITLPTENWLPFITFISIRANCQLACMKLEYCHGYELKEDNRCSLGVLKASAESGNYVPEYVFTGHTAFIKSLVLKRKALSVNHLASLWNIQIYDTPFEDDRVAPLEYPAPFEGNSPILTTLHKGHFINCMGELDGTYLKSCRTFSFKTKRWNTLPGESVSPHYEGAAAIAGNKIYAFCGRNWFGITSNYSEVYDFATGRWEELPAAPYAVKKNSVVAISETRLLLVGGQLSDETQSNSNYLYDTSIKQYLPVPDRDTGFANGMGVQRQSCALLPDGARVMCAGGYTHEDGATKRVHIYNIASNTWSTDPAWDLPWKGFASLVSLGQRFFIVYGSDSAWEVKEGQDPMYERMEKGINKGACVFYQMDYNKLLIP